MRCAGYGLTAYDAVLFDLDGVLTPTAELHRHAWQRLFDELFAQWQLGPPYTADDYFALVDGRHRYEGVAAVLRSRDAEVPWGEPADAADAATVCGIGNRKNAVFHELLAAEGITPYPGSLRVLDLLRAAGVPLAVVSSSRNAGAVLAAAGIADRFAVVVDGLLAERERLASKPAPDMFAAAARMLGVDPARTAAVEDATSGVASATAAGCALVAGVDRGVGEAALLAAGAQVVVLDVGELMP